jgi:hypothetical protein
MPPAKRTEPASPPPLPAPSYPAIEAFVERATPGDVDQAFASLAAPLADLKGPRAAQGKKVEGAVARTRELMLQLLEVRERLAADQKGKRR